MQPSNMLVFLLFLIRFCFLYLEAVDGDTLIVDQPLSSNNTLVSSGGVFELGFFTPAGSSLKDYIGVWFKQSEKQTVIWVANREFPVVKRPGTLTLREHGVLEISDCENEIIWSSNSSESVLNPVAQLLNSGNFVVKSGNQNATSLFAWQGFDYPCDTRLPGMKIGYNVRKKHNVYLSSWKSLDDPAEGSYSFQLDVTGIPQYFYKNGSREIFRLGPWNGQAFSGAPDMKPDASYEISYTSDDEWIYFELEPIGSPEPSRTVLYVNGSWLVLIGYNDDLVKNMTRDYVTQKCDGYNYCGPYATCDTNKSPVCECLTGYMPKFQRDWDMADWTNGCVKTNNCSTGDKFVKLSNIKIPDTRNAYGNMTWSLKECMTACMVNCSCTAYGIWNVTYGGTGCLLWFGELKDIRVYHENGQDIFIRGDVLDIGPYDNVKVIMKGSIVSALVLLAVVALIICYRKRKASKKPQSGNKYEISEIPLFDLETICTATNNFSAENKLGEGGFGPVYKGMLRGGLEIAVKKLSGSSKQGSIEFRNEVMCIAKLQHRNLVRLLGCCNQEQYMLIYEYMPNKSLDLFIFDEKNRALLDWSKRWNIINGIARGLLYLHQDSELIIIHRDLKSSNVLLDCDMNPKISDFGMARICESSEATANTTRVVGTYGYMSPEYAIEGRFSVKSDVFSFGVMLLEIISGRRNRSFNHPDRYLNLLGHVYHANSYSFLRSSISVVHCVSKHPFLSRHGSCLDKKDSWK